MRLSSAISVGTIMLASGAGCTWETKLPAGASAIHIERTRELLITDDVVLGALSGNAANGPMSFRRAMDHLPSRAPAGPSTLAWLRAWSKELRDEGEPARADAFDANVTCAWLRRNPANDCTDACACAASALRLEDAPFRLIAIANRTDLSVMPDRAADGGEGRLVFALTDGPSDAAESRALPLTVILEYAQQGSATDWANRWHALATPTDEAFPAKLSELASVFVDSGSLAQIRSADALTGALVLHEFRLASGDLVAARVRNTPDWASVPEDDVRAFARDHADAIESGTHVLPSSWLASSSELERATPPYLATVPSHDALVHGTCGGCHHDTERGFQIDPREAGDRKISRFLLDPSKASDELGRRTQWMQLTLSR